MYGAWPSAEWSAGVGALFVAAKPALQKILTVLAVVLLAGVVVTAVFCAASALADGALTSFGAGTVSRGYAVFSLVILAPWAFAGFEVTSFDTAHFRFPMKKTGGLIVLSILAAGFAYASMALSILLSLLGRNTLNRFVDLTSFGAIVGFGYSSAAAYKLARTEGNRRVQITGAVGTVISVLFAVVQLVPRLSAMEAMGSEAFLLLSLWCLLGFVFYWRTVSRGTLTEYSGMSASGVALFALLLYAALMWMAKRLMAGGTAEEIKASLTGGGIAVESSLAKSQFLFNMSHDIHTPMNAIIGYTDLAQKETDIAAVQGYLDKINGSSQHLLALINDILEMSRIESGKVQLEFVPTDLGAVFNGMRDLFSEQMKRKDMDFSVHTGQVQHRYVRCDRKNLNRVLLNVLSNAYKFTPEGGTVTASVWEVGNGENGYGSYEMRVRDNGIGMSKEFADRIFDAFERERTSTVSGIEGTGLGMSITKSIVDLMGGTIEVMTAPGSGTEIIIRLKFKLAEEKDIPEEERMAVSAGGEADGEGREVDLSTKRVLLVEDNKINMEIAEMILAQAGVTVETAENGKLAVERVAASEPGYYDAILMDIQMPVMDGYAATRAIRAMDNPGLAGIPILAMTANAFKEDVEAAREAGMQAHIAKPVDVNVLMSTLKSVLR